MNKRIGIAAMLLLMAAAIAPAARAATDTTFTWSGTGSFGATFNSDNDAKAQVQANGWTSGTFYAKDFGDNPYSYGVDTTLAQLDSDILGGGNIYFKFNRMDSKVSMYGPADQWTQSYVGSSGTGGLTFRSQSNYAALVSSNYGFQSDNQFTASGGSYLIQHDLYNGANYGGLQASGSGTMAIDHMSDDTGNTAFNFGRGAGCYTNANVDATGSGAFGLLGFGGAGLSGNGWGMGGPATYSATWTFGGGLTVSNYAFGGN